MKKQTLPTIKILIAQYDSGEQIELNLMKFKGGLFYCVVDDMYIMDNNGVFSGLFATEPTPEGIYNVELI